MDYKKQGEDFLKKTKTTLEFVRCTPQKSPLWAKEGEEHGTEYTITLKNEKGEYSFGYWGSIADKEEKRKPTAYSILACLDVFDGDFSEFCSCFGYDEDSRTAEKTFHAVQEQSNNLRRIFTHKELGKLQEIN